MTHIKRDLAFWGYVRDTRDAGTLGWNTENGLALENRRRTSKGESSTDVPSLATEFKTTQIRITTELCEYEKACRHYNLGIEDVPKYVPKDEPGA